MSVLKKAFSVAALGLGGTGTVWAGLGLLTGGWSSTSVDMTTVGMGITALSAGLFYGGYRGLKSSFSKEFPSSGNNDNNLKRFTPKP